MKTRFALYTFAVLLVTRLLAVAQEVPVAEVAFGYSLINVHPNLAPITSFNLNGGGGAFVYNVTPWIGIKGELQGYATSSGFKNGWRGSRA